MLAVCCYRNREWHHKPSGGKGRHWLALTVGKIWNFGEQSILKFYPNDFSSHIFSFNHYHTFRTSSHNHASLLTINWIQVSALHMRVGGFLGGSCFLKCAKSLWRLTWLLVGWMLFTLNSTLQSFPTLRLLAENRHVPLYKQTFWGSFAQAVFSVNKN